MTGTWRCRRQLSSVPVQASVTGGGQEPSVGSKPGCDPRHKRRLLVEWHVNERIKADDRVEGRSGEVHRGRIGPDEGCAGNQLAGAADLDVAEIDAGNRNRAFGEPWMYLHVRR